MAGIIAGRRVALVAVYFATIAALILCLQTIHYVRELDYCAPSTPMMDDTSCCRIGTIEDINHSVFSHLTELLSTPFFRYYKINLSRPCPFWKEDLICTSEGCSIATLPKDPNGWEAKLSDIQFPTFQLAGSVFRAWEYDENEFCQLDREGESGVYVDLIENPERFTGYSGPSANRVWQSIYEENCFSNGKESNSFGNSAWQQCVERQVFYRVVSGLHASISVHLSDQYFNKELCRASCRLAPKIQDMTFSMTDKEENVRVKKLLLSISDAYPSCPETFDRALFSTNTKPEIVEEFKEHFRNVTKIMNCVSCERCRLWGKVQTTGIGTALKILFLSEDEDQWQLASFRRSEIISLYNALGRVSESIDAVRRFRDFHETLENEKYSVRNIILFYLQSMAHPLFLVSTALILVAICGLTWREIRKIPTKKTQ